MLVLIFSYLSALDPVMIVLILNNILDLVGTVSCELLVEICFAMVLMIYLYHNIHIVGIFNYGRSIREVHINIEFNTSLAEFYICCVSVFGVAYRSISRNTVSGMLLISLPAYSAFGWRNKVCRLDTVFGSDVRIASFAAPVVCYPVSVHTGKKLVLRSIKSYLLLFVFVSVLIVINFFVELIEHYR